jgi:hypothetical protein
MVKAKQIQMGLQLLQILHPFAGRRIVLSEAFFGITNVRLASAR